MASIGVDLRSNIFEGREGAVDGRKGRLTGTRRANLNDYGERTA